MKEKNTAFNIIIIKGVLHWGLKSAVSFTILFTIFFWLYAKLFSDSISFFDMLFSTAIWAFLLFPVGGLIWGIIMWSIFGKKSGETT